MVLVESGSSTLRSLGFNDFGRSPTLLHIGIVPMWSPENADSIGLCSHALSLKIIDNAGGS